MRSTTRLRSEAVARLLHAVNWPRPSRNGAPSQQCMVVRRHPETGERRLDLLQWPLSPYWAKEPKRARRPINVRASGMVEAAFEVKPWPQWFCLGPLAGSFIARNARAMHPMPVALSRSSTTTDNKAAARLEAVPHSALLRAEAVTAANTPPGAVLGVVPISWSVITLFLVAIMVALISFASMINYARKVAADGILVPVKGATRVLPPRPGTVASVAVSEGDQVAIGQVLFSVDAHRSLANGATLDLKQTALLSNQASLMTDQIAAAKTRARLSQGRLSERIKSLTAEVENTIAQHDLQAARSRLAEEDLKSVASLRAQGLLSEVEFRNRQDLVLSLKQGSQKLEEQEIDLRRQIEEAAGEVARLPNETSDQVARLQSSLIDIQQRMMEMEISGTEVVRAPISARVSAVYVHPGQHADPDRPALTLLPLEGGLQADLYIPARAIGFVAKRQLVRLKYEAFPYQQFGTHSGYVEQVDSTLLSPHDLDSPHPLKEPSYRVRVALDEQTVQAFGHTFPLQPEMGVSADIVLESQSLLSWLLQPIYALRGHL